MNKKTRTLITILAIILAALMVIPLILEMIPTKYVQFQFIDGDGNDVAYYSDGSQEILGPHDYSQDAEPEDEGETETSETPADFQEALESGDDVMLEWDEVSDN